MAKAFSNRYMLLYAAALVTVAALLLTIVSVSLKPRQERNKAAEQKQMILKTIGVEASRDNAAELFEQYFTVGESPNGSSAEEDIHGGTPLHYDGGIVIPIQGSGLWGPIWGYLALDSNATVVGAVFDHQGETPGLGGEIATDKFAARFIGKRMDSQPIRLKKNADNNNPYQVDVISGATMTSNGVTEMLEQAYENYKNLIAQNSRSNQIDFRKEAAQ